MRALVRLFPRRFRKRYETELVDLLEASEPTWRDGADLLRSALSLHVESVLTSLRRWARARRRLLLAVVLAAGTGAVFGSCTGLGVALTIAGCSMLGGAAAGGVLVSTVAIPQLLGRALLPRVGG
jgi:hypothetical protein